MAPRELERHADERESPAAVAGQFLQVQVLQDVDALLRQQVDVGEQGRSRLRVALVGHVPGHVVGAHGDDACSAAHRVPDFPTPAASR